MVKMDINKYTEKKQKGILSLSKLGDAFALTQKRWSAETGEALQAEVVAISKEETEKTKAELVQRIADLDALLSDMKSL